MRLHPAAAPLASCSRQRGAAALAVCVLLLFVMALVATYVHRSLLFEQRTSANHYRATMAFALAEAGIDWATAMLNDPRPIDDACNVAAAGASFRQRFAPDDAASHALSPLATGFVAACTVSDERLDCRCAPAGAVLHARVSGDAAFSVRLAAMPGEPDAVRMTAHGCAGGTDDSCAAATPTALSQARAAASVALARKPLLRVVPAAALTAAGAVSITGPAMLVNLDADAGGMLVEAGGAVTIGPAARLESLPGDVRASRVTANDTTLGGVGPEPDPDVSFHAFFGTPRERFDVAPMVRQIVGDTASARGAALRHAHGEGFGAFVVDGDLTLDAAGAGTADRPVLIVTRHRIDCDAPCRIHGLLYFDVAERDADDAADVDLHGAGVTAGHHDQTLGGRVAYDGAALQRLRRQTSMLVRVPGSWRDF